MITLSAANLPAGAAPAGDQRVANGFGIDKTEYYRNLFENLYRQPAAHRPLPPSANALVRLGVTLGGLLSTSSGEQFLLALTGQIDPSVSARDLQFASAALEQTGIDVSYLRDQWSREQKSAFLRTAAIVGEDLIDGRIDAGLAREAILYLIDETGRLNRSSGSQGSSQLA